MHTENNACGCPSSVNSENNIHLTHDDDLKTRIKIHHETPYFDIAIPLSHTQHDEISILIAQLVFKAFPHHFANEEKANHRKQPHIEKHLDVLVRKTSIYDAEDNSKETEQIVQTIITRIESEESLEEEIDNVESDLAEEIEEETGFVDHHNQSSVIVINELAESTTTNNGQSVSPSSTTAGEKTLFDDIDTISLTSDLDSSMNNSCEIGMADCAKNDDTHENDMAGLNEKIKKKGFWRHLLQKHIHVKQLTGGTTNRLYLVKFLDQDDLAFNTLQPRKVLVRCFGQHSENLIDRQAEFHYIQQISSYYPELAPRIYCQFENGLIYRYFEGDGLDELGGAPNHYLHIAKLMNMFHSIRVEPFGSSHNRDHPSEYKPVVFTRTHNWMKLLTKNREAFKKRGGNSLPEDTILDIDLIEREVSQIEKLCGAFPIAFCHNDVGAHNIIYNKQSTDENEGELESYHLIDFEYCGYNYASFDIGNFFCEFGGLNINPDAYPTPLQQTSFLRSYFGSRNVTDAHIEYTRRQANVMSLVSNLHWSVWSMLQSMFSAIDFNYLEYADRRMTWYFKMKDHALALLNDTHVVPHTLTNKIEEVEENNTVTIVNL